MMQPHKPISVLPRAARFPRWAVCASLIAGLAFAGHPAERGQAEHVVILVWDGLRPDYITPQYTPTLFKLARKGVFFKNHHPVFPSTTEVNGTAIATGVYPDHSGIMANTEYRPEISWMTPHATEGIDAVRRGDFLTDGHYLAVATLPEMLQQTGAPNHHRQQQTGGAPP